MAPLHSYLASTPTPAERPPRSEMAETTRTLHNAIDETIRQSGRASLHPEGDTVQTDLFGSPQMIAWQEQKGARTMLGEACWSNLPPIYGRYGTEPGNRLIQALQALEDARGVLLTDCGMQASALALDVLLKPGGHALISRQVYNKSKACLDWMAQRMGVETTVVDHLSPEELQARVQPNTTLVFAETYTNPLMQALDLEGLSEGVLKLRQERAIGLRLVIDNTIVTPWGVKKPLLDYEGIDVVVAAGTKAMSGEDRDMWGYLASRRVDLLNRAMDLQAMRGGVLSWRAARALLETLPRAEAHFRKRCESAAAIVHFLEAHPNVSEVFHPHASTYGDRALFESQYQLGGSLLSFRVNGLSEDQTRHFCDVVATTGLIRYSLSFDGLVTKINHHQTVSEYYCPPPLLKKQGIDRLVRLAVGVEDTDDLIACLNWALWHHGSLSNSDVRQHQVARINDLGLPMPESLA